MSDVTDRPDTPLGYAQSACDTMMRRYAAADLPPKGHFHYHQGLFFLYERLGRFGVHRRWPYQK